MRFRGILAPKGIGICKDYKGFRHGAGRAHKIMKYVLLAKTTEFSKYQLILSKFHEIHGFSWFLMEKVRIFTKRYVLKQKR